MSRSATLATGTPRRHPLDRIGIPKALFWGYAGLLFFMVGDGVETSYLSKYFGSDLGFSETGAGAIITVYGVTAAIGSFFGAGLLSDRWGPRRVMAVGAGVWGVFHVLMLSVAIPSGNYALVMLTYGIRGFGYPMFAYGFLSWIMAVAPKDHQSKAVGWFWFCYSAGYPIIGSFLFAAAMPVLGFYATLWLSLGLITVGSLIVLLLLRERTGFTGLAPGRDSRQELVGTFKILFEQPKIGMSLIIRLINTTPSFGMWVFMPFFVRDLGFSDGEWNTLLVIMMVTNLGALLIFGVLGDNWSGRKTCALFGGVLGAVGCLLCYYLPAAAGYNFLVAAVAVAVYGAGLAGYVPLPAMMVAQAPERRGQVMGVYTLGAGLSVAVGPLIGTVSYSSFGFQGLMWIYASLLLLNAVLCLRVTSPGDGMPDGADGAGGSEWRPDSEAASAEAIGSGATDAGTVDAGTADSWATDTGTADSGTTDTETADAGATDAGTTDTETVDAETTDAGAVGAKSTVPEGRSAAGAPA